MITPCRLIRSPVVWCNVGQRPAIPDLMFVMFHTMQVDQITSGLDHAGATTCLMVVMLHALQVDQITSGLDQRVSGVERDVKEATAGSLTPSTLETQLKAVSLYYMVCVLMCVCVCVSVRVSFTSICVYGCVRGNTRDTPV